MSHPHSLTVLYVDDDSAVRGVVLMHLKNAGFHSFAVSSGREALDFIEFELVDLIILDYQMPEMDGHTLASEIRLRRPEIPLLMISGNPAIPQSTLKLVDRFVVKDEMLHRTLVAEAFDLFAARHA